MTDRWLRTAFLGLMWLAVPAGLAAQEVEAPAAAPQSGAAAAAQLPPEAQELLVELQELQARLQPIQLEALQDPGIQAAQAELGEEIQAAMAEVDPATPERIERLQALMGQAEAAQAEQDQAAMGEIVAEARIIEQRLQATQAEAVQRPDIAPQVEQFQSRLLARMVEVDPEAEALIEKARELDARLASLLGAGS